MSLSMRVFVSACAALVAVVSGSVAAELLPTKNDGGKLLPADRSIAEVVDHYVDAKLAAAKIAPAPPADDANLVRRLTLDLAGRIPTPPEVRAFVESKDADKREQLVDRLLASPEFLDRQVNEFDWMLMQGTGSLREYLSDAVRRDVSWEAMFRELMLAGDDEPAKGATEFLKTRVKDQDRLTNDVSSLFFGVNISCAQCHDHPLVPDWKQDHFYGLKSFFNRTYENGGFLGERDYGGVTFQTPKGKQHDAGLMFLTGLKLDEPEAKEPDGKAKKAEQELLKKLADKKQPPPKPKYSRRSALVDAALRPDQRHFFARSIVNRLWHRLFGYGLVMPLDQMHSGNPPSHPELMDWLARDVAEHDFDLTRMVRGLVLSRAYARSSRWTKGPRPESSLFAVAQVRPLAPEQYAASLRIATTDPDVWKSQATLDDVSKKARGLVSSARELARSFAAPSDDFQVGVTESLLLANSSKVQDDLLSEADDRLVGRLKQVTDVNERIDLTFEAILNRPSDAAEHKLLSAYLADRRDRPTDAARQIVWALLTGSEFRFNY